MKKYLLSFLLSGAILSAAPVTVSFVNAGSPAQTGYGFYVGPYTLNVDGKNVAAMCMDDFLTVSGTWSANITSANSSHLSNTYLGIGSTQIGYTLYGNSQIYKAEAYLFSLITKQGSNRPDIQEAAWALMGSHTYGTVYSSNNSSVKNYIQTALTQSSTFDASGFSIISQAGVHNEQEFIYSTATPEPATFALFGGALFAIGGFRRFFRRKQVAA